MRRPILALMTTAIALFTCCKEKDPCSEIIASVERQMELYPHSTLRDLYKNYFQDYFGPGHIIADSSSADKYLRHELNSTTSFGGPDYEPTGYRGSFYRVNLSVIADGRVPYELFFDAFVRSVNGIKPIATKEWQKEWAKIDSVINVMDVLPATAATHADRVMIENMLNAGNVVMHHSEEFSRHYQPHYRIIERSIFEQEILPLINKNK